MPGCRPLAADAAADAAAAAASAAAPHPSLDSAKLGVCREDCAPPLRANIQRGVGALLVLLRLLLLFVLGQVPFPRLPCDSGQVILNRSGLRGDVAYRVNKLAFLRAASPFVARAPCLRGE